LDPESIPEGVAVIGNAFFVSCGMLLLSDDVRCVATLGDDAGSICRMSVNLRNSVLAGHRHIGAYVQAFREALPAIFSLKSATFVVKKHSCIFTM